MKFGGSNSNRNGSLQSSLFHRKFSFPFREASSNYLDLTKPEPANKRRIWLDPLVERACDERSSNNFLSCSD